MRSLPAIFLAGTLMAQVTPIDIAKLLGSSRSDLWVLGVGKRTADLSMEVQICSWKLAKENWGLSYGVKGYGTGSEAFTVLHSERPLEWDWKQKPAAYLRGESNRFHLSKYDDHSAFSSKWGLADDDKYIEEGTILRSDGGHLKVIPNALKQARMDYGLSATQDFLGMVGDKVFYFDPAQADRISFFEKNHPNQRFDVIVPTHPWWPRSWKLERAAQVFEGERPDEILVYIWAKNTVWISSKPRRESMGVPVDLKTAKPAAGGVK